MTLSMSSSSTSPVQVLLLVLLFPSARLHGFGNWDRRQILLSFPRWSWGRSSAASSFFFFPMALLLVRVSSCSPFVSPNGRWSDNSFAIDSEIMETALRALCLATVGSRFGQWYWEGGDDMAVCFPSPYVVRRWNRGAMELINVSGWVLTGDACTAIMPEQDCAFIR